MNEPKVEKECATCKYAGVSLLEDPCYGCLRITTRFKGETYPEWEPREDNEK